LRSVANVECRSSVLPGPRLAGLWSTHGRTAVRRAHRGALPEVIRPTGPATGWRLATAGAEVVKIGKFDVDRQVRLRAFYTDLGLSVRCQAAGPGSSVERTVAAFTHVQQH